MNSELLDFIKKYKVKPALYEQGEDKFWNDPYISKSMLEAHLNFDNDAASRKIETINKTINYLFETKIIKPGMKVLDLGCGPGLYAERLCQSGAKVTGLDISERSINYAKSHAEEAGLNIEYNCTNYFDMDYSDEFDAAIQIYGDLCVFSDEKRNTLLNKIYKALRKDGILIFDVTTRTFRMKKGIKSSWYVKNGGFWNPAKHLVLEQSFDYPDEKVWLEQYIVIDCMGAKVYRNWFHDYSFEAIKSVLDSAGFKIQFVWNDLTGSPFTEDSDWIAIAAVKEN